MKGVRKYAAFFVAAMRDHGRHRARFGLRFCAFLLFSIVFAELWALVYREEIVTLPYTLADMQWYSVLTQMVLFLSPRFFMVVEEDVRSGDIAYFLTRPVPYMWMRLSEGAGALNAHVLFYYCLGIPLVAAYIGAWPTDPFMLGAALIGIYIASFIHLGLQMAAGITAIWLQDADAVYRVYQKLLIVLGGLYLPVTLYPDALADFAALTPFYAMIYAPAQLVLAGDGPGFASVLVLQLFWLGVALVLAHLMNMICLKRVEINGG